MHLSHSVSDTEFSFRTTMSTRPLRSIPMELSNFAHTCSIPLPIPSVAANVSFSSQHNQPMARPYHLLGGAVGHSYSNDLHNEILDWDPASILDPFDFPLDLSIQSYPVEDGGIIAASDDIHKQSDLPELDDELISDENPNPLVPTYWNDLLLDTSSTSASSQVVNVTFRRFSCLQISLFASSIDKGTALHHEQETRVL